MSLHALVSRDAQRSAPLRVAANPIRDAQFGHFHATGIWGLEPASNLSRFPSVPGDAAAVVTCATTNRHWQDIRFYFAPRLVQLSKYVIRNTHAASDFIWVSFICAGVGFGLDVRVRVHA
jgi:hypothetical protein